MCSTMNVSGGECKITITTDPSNGAFIWIYDITDSAWLEQGTKMEPADVVVPCNHYFKVSVRKPDHIYAPKNWPKDWAQSSDKSYLTGQVTGNTPLHFSGDVYSVSINVEKTSTLGGCPSTTVLVPFTIIITNDATISTGASLTSFVIKDTLPNGLSYYSSNPVATSVSGNVITWTLNNPLAPGGSFNILLNTIINVGATSGVKTNNVLAVGSTAIGTSAQDSASSTTTVYQNPIATITKKLPL
jgi:hypothetical protein